MRVGFDIAKAARPRDGIGRYGAELLRALVELDHDDEYFLYDLHHEVSEEEAEALFDELPANVLLKLGGDPGRDALDVFHATCWMLPEGHLRPSVFTCYDLTFYTMPAFHDARNRLTCMTGMLEAIVGGAHFVAISGHTRDEMITRFEIDPARISVVHPGAGDRFERVDPEPARARLASGLKIERPFILSVGTVEPRKNHLQLLHAYAALPAPLREGFDLVIAGGRGWLDDDFYARLDAKAELGGVHVLGFVEERDLVDLYSACSVFVYPSLAEGFGLPLLEALRCGAPAIASDRPVLAEVAGEAALYVDPERPEEIADALARVLESDELARGLRDRIDVGAFSWERAARETLELYARLTAG